MEDTLSLVKSVDGANATFCVTGATGYIGSTLVAALLERGYTVHATVRDLEKSKFLLSLAGGERLRLFKADLYEEGSFDEAIRGCDGVFHLAVPMDFNVDYTIENFDAYIQANLIDPAVKGTLNLLKSCAKFKSVKKVVYTSSLGTITAKDRNGKWKSFVDESCQVEADVVWNTRAGGWIYVLSKLLSEQAAWKFAKENGIDLVSVISTTVGGPFFTPSVPGSVKILMSPITGETFYYDILDAVSVRMGSFPSVHIEDISRAHIFVMEHPKAEGSYICRSQTCPLSDIVNLIGKEYSYTNMKRIPKNSCDEIPCDISTKKLTDLGFSYKHGLEDIFIDSIKGCIDVGYLPPISQ